MRDWLVTLRHEKGLTEKEVSTALNIAQPHYHRIEHDEGDPSVRLAKKIGEFYGVDWTRLFDAGRDSA